MSVPHLADLEARFYGAYGGGVTTDAKYTALRTFASQGITWRNLAGADKLYDSVEGVVYAGTALGGSGTDEPVWAVTRIALAEDGTIDTLTTATDVAWDDRLTVEYA